MKCRCPLCAMSCRCRQTDAHARSLRVGLISRNSRSARSASASSKGQSCRHCSDHRKSQAGQNSASRHRTRNNLGLDRYTKGAGCDAPCAKPKLSGRKLEGRYSGADNSPAGSRSRASVAPAGHEPAQPARRPGAALRTGLRSPVMVPRRSAMPSRVRSPPCPSNCDDH